MPTQTASDDFNAIIIMPFGPLGIACDDGQVRQIAFLPPNTPALAPQSALAERSARALQAWLEAPERPPDLPLARRGTAFQNRVWQLIADIRPGRVRTYRDLAAELGSAPRAVGGACGANPFPLLVPCHRVVAQNGLGGFARDTDGHLLRVKRWLLAHEAAA